jgi:uncharacterized phiE125 gp8 family phage protein
MSLTTWGQSLVTPPTAEPVTTADLKNHALIDGSDQDATIPLYISAARRKVESMTNRALMTQTWDLWFAAFPREDRIRLPHSPVQSLTYFRYFDTADNQLTVDSTTYDFRGESEPAEIVLRYARIWPTTVLRPSSGVQVRAVCGYASADLVPEPLRLAILMLTAHFYENKLPVEKGMGGLTTVEIPFTVKGLVADYELAKHGY